MHKRLILFLIAALLLIGLPVLAHEGETPTVEIADQNILDGTVTVDRVYSEGVGFMVIHADADGAPGPVVGFRWVPHGWVNEVNIRIDPALVTPVLYAMLHTDDNVVGTYEFGTVEGADAPVILDGSPVSPAFNVQMISSFPQKAASTGTFTADFIVTDAPAWLVIHADENGSFGGVLGQTLVEPGNTADVAVALSGDVTGQVWPMLHVDTGEAGVYEFGTVEGADAPIMTGDRIAATPISTQPIIWANPQVLLNTDGQPAIESPTFLAKALLSETAGWLVIHSDNNGAPGPAAGYVAVSEGTNRQVSVPLDPALITPILWPMLHVDTGEAGVYEFGTVEGADVPATVNGNIVMRSVIVAPSIFTVEDIGLSPETAPNELYIPLVLADTSGWLVIHSSVDGAPNAVIGQVQILRGVNIGVRVTIDPALLPGEAEPYQAFPMLHYDTGAEGVYEFGMVEGADAPMSLNGRVITRPTQTGIPQ